MASLDRAVNGGPALGVVASIYVNAIVLALDAVSMGVFLQERLNTVGVLRGVVVSLHIDVESGGHGSLQSAGDEDGFEQHFQNATMID